jgi:hypothetical protein
MLAVEHSEPRKNSAPQALFFGDIAALPAALKESAPGKYSLSACARSSAHRAPRM